jgi:hypothetical protein
MDMGDSNLSNLVQELQVKLKEKTLIIKNLEDMLKSAGKKIDKQSPAADDPLKLQQKIADLDAENQKLRESLANQQNTGSGGPLTTLVKDLQGKIKKKDEEIAKLRGSGNIPSGQQPASSGDDAPKLQQKIAEQDAEIQKLRDEITIIKARESRSEQAGPMGPMADLVKDLQRKLKSREEEIERLKTSTGHKATGLDKSGDVDQLKVQVNAFSVSNTELRKTVEILQKEVRQKEQLILGLQDENKLLKDQSRGGGLPSGDQGTLAEENRVLSDKLTKTRQQIQYLSDDLARKNQDILLLQQYRSKDAMEVVQKERDTMKASFQSMQEKLATMQKEQEDGGTHQQMLRFRELRSMLDSMKRQIRLQNQELNEVKKKIIIV